MQSLQLLGLGMGSVFIILTMLIAIVTLISRIVPEPEPEPAPVAQKRQQSVKNTEHIAAIQAAIHKFRRSRTH
ncbi:MAG: sodium pump decarboxylase subunit gamma [Gammaproteobacteria bacterium]|nr:sodium pump decarboxylase subunit gamma [Gammaproteobacteria bacterium]